MAAAPRGSHPIFFTIRTSRMGSDGALVASLASPSSSPSERAGWGRTCVGGVVSLTIFFTIRTSRMGSDGALVASLATNLLHHPDKPDGVGHWLGGVARRCRIATFLMRCSRKPIPQLMMRRLFVQWSVVSVYEALANARQCCAGKFATIPNPYPAFRGSSGMVTAGIWVIDPGDPTSEPAILAAAARTKLDAAPEGRHRNNCRRSRGEGG